MLLATARVRVAGCFGKLHAVRVLVDQGSEASIVSEALVQRLRVPRRRANITILGVGGKQSGIATGKVSLRIFPRQFENEVSVNDIIVPRLTSYSCDLDCSTKNWAHLRNLELADPEFSSSDVLDMLIGADFFATIVRPGLRQAGPTAPVAQETVFGWILSGVCKLIGAQSSRHDTAVCNCGSATHLGEVLGARGDSSEARAHRPGERI